MVDDFNILGKNSVRRWGFVQPNYSAVADRRQADNPPLEAGRSERSQYLRTMADRENLVYQAKLAEQAERYDGKLAAPRAGSPPARVPARGIRAQVQPFTWVGRARDKMAERSLAE